MCDHLFLQTRLPPTTKASSHIYPLSPLIHSSNNHLPAPSLHLPPLLNQSPNNSWPQPPPSISAMSPQANDNPILADPAARTAVVAYALLAQAVPPRSRLLRRDAHRVCDRDAVQVEDGARGLARDEGVGVGGGGEPGV